MSLRVWLPLDGDLHNQGISDLIFSAASSNTTTNANGKIGTCYTNNSHSAGGLISDKPILLGSQYSMCCWFKFTDLEANSNLGGGLISQHRYSKNTGFGLTIKYVSSTTGYLSVNTGTGSARTYNTYCGTTLLQANTWYHACGTYDGVNIKIYLNGILEKTQAYNMSAPEDYLTIFCWSLGGSSGAAIHGDYKLNGALNDVRIYDHCLSAAEVKEIAQGLILHYKLDGVCGGTNRNLLRGSATIGNTSAGIYGWVSNGTASNIEKLDGEIIHYSYNLSNSKNIPSITTNTAIACEFGKSYTYTMELKLDREIVLGGSTPMHYWIGARNTNVITNTSCNGNLTGITTTWVQNHNSERIPANTWVKIITTFTFPAAASNSDYPYPAIRCFVYGSSLTEAYTGVVNVWMRHCKIEEGRKSTPWVQAIEDIGIDNTIIEDSSGYGHNGICVNTTTTSDTPRYNTCISCMGTTVDTSSNTITGAQFFYCNMDMPTTNAITIAWWGKNITYGRGGIFETSNTTQTDTAKGMDYNITAFANWDTTFGIYNGSTRINIFSNFARDGIWHYHAITFDGANVKYYLDSVLKQTSALTGTLPAWKSFCVGLGRAGGVWRQIQQYISDFRIYCTPLLDTDIKQLYNVGMKIDKLGSAHSFEFIEQQSNIIFPIELSRSNLTFTNGLSRYTQANCQVTLTDQGYRIYRPPNLTTANNGNTMFGGLKLVNQSNDMVSPYNATRDNIWQLQKGHTYIIAFHAKGQSSNPTNYMSFNNNMGWGVGGVSPKPTVITSSAIPTNFNGEKECYYIFTITDEIVKTSNDARANYDGSSDYLSYRHFTFGWTYSDTGTLGTDLYLTNFRLYDITNYTAKITRQGQIKFTDFIEQLDKAQIRRNSEFLSSNFIER